MDLKPSTGYRGIRDHTVHKFEKNIFVGKIIGLIVTRLSIQLGTILRTIRTCMKQITNSKQIPFPSHSSLLSAALNIDQDRGRVSGRESFLSLIAICSSQYAFSGLVFYYGMWVSAG